MLFDIPKLGKAGINDLAYTKFYLTPLKAGKNVDCGVVSNFDRVSGIDPNPDIIKGYDTDGLYVFIPITCLGNALYGNVYCEISVSSHYHILNRKTVKRSDIVDVKKVKDLVNMHFVSIHTRFG